MKAKRYGTSTRLQCAKKSRCEKLSSKPTTRARESRLLRVCSIDVWASVKWFPTASSIEMEMMSSMGTTKWFERRFRFQNQRALLTVSTRRCCSCFEKETSIQESS